MIHIPELNIPYRKHTKDERAFFEGASGVRALNWTIFDIERFWSQTTKSAKEAAEKLTKAGFLLSRRISNQGTYHGSDYNVGLYSIIFPSGTNEEILEKPLLSRHPDSKRGLGTLIYWKEGGFDEEPIKVQYGLDIDSPQSFEEVARLEKFLRASNLPFQVTPAMEDVKRLIEDHRKRILRAENYLKERGKTFKIN